MKLKPGDKVMISWPTGKSEHEVVNKSDLTYIVRANGTNVTVPKEWLSPIKPKIEPERLCCYYDDGNTPVEAKLRSMIINEWDHIEPVFRRFDELTDSEREEWATYLDYPFGIYKEDIILLWNKAIEILSKEKSDE